MDRSFILLRRDLVVPLGGTWVVVLCAPWSCSELQECYWVTFRVPDKSESLEKENSSNSERGQVRSCDELNLLRDFGTEGKLPPMFETSFRDARGVNLHYLRPLDVPSRGPV